MRSYHVSGIRQLCWLGLAALVVVLLWFSGQAPQASAPVVAQDILPTATSTPVCQDAIQNGGFETYVTGEAEPWERSGPVSYSTDTPYSGVYSAHLGGANDATGSLSQSITLSGDALPESQVSELSLSYYRGVSTLETVHPADYLYVRLYDSADQLLATLETLTDGDVDTWQRSEFDLLPYKGQTVRLTFEFVTDAQNTTSFFVDDVALDVCLIVQPTSTYTPKPSSTPTDKPTATPTATLTPVASATPSLTPSPVTVTFRAGDDGYTGTYDAFLDRWYPTTNYGATSLMNIRSDDARRPVIQFDVSSIPAGVTILDARLHLMTDFYRSHPQVITVSAYGLKRAWYEREVTWNEAQSGISWTLPGANSTAGDRDEVATDSCPIYETAAWYNWDLTPLVQEWVDGARVNHGVVMVGTGNTCEMRFWTSASSALIQRPKLVVQYSWGGLPPATSTPTPLPSATPSVTPSPTVTPPVGGPEIVLQNGLNGYTGVVDTHLSEWQPTSNFGNNSRLAVRRGGVRSALVRFNLGSLPPGITVTEARVEMFCVARTNAGVMTISAHRVTKWWGERVANWTVAANNLLWGIPGCKEYHVDLGFKVLSSVEATAMQQWYSWDVTGQMQSWLGGARNNGLIFRGDGPAAVEYNFLSSESTWNQPLTPRLVIKYAP